MAPDLQSELLSGESVLWEGKPQRRVVFHRGDLLLVPFSLVWGGGATFIGFGAFTGSEKTTPLPFALIPLLFFAVGQYIIWGRFVYALWQKGHTVYALTNMRLISHVRVFSGWASSSVNLEEMASIDKEIRSDGIGTLRFGDSQIRRWGRGAAWNQLDGYGGTFVDIEDAERVHRMILEAQQAAT